MASNQKNENSYPPTEVSTEVSTPVIGTPPLNVAPPQLNMGNLSRRLETIHKGENSVGKRLYKQYKSMKHTNLRRAPLARQFDFFQKKNDNGQAKMVVTHRDTGEVVDVYQWTLGGKHRRRSRRSRQSRQSRQSRGRSRGRSTRRHRILSL